MTAYFTFEQNSSIGLRKGQYGGRYCSSRQPEENDCYMIGDLNISKCFYDFQMFITSLVGADTLNFESNLQHILSLLSIPLLRKKRVHPDFNKLLLTGTVDDIINDAHENIGIQENKFTRLISTQMLDIVQDVYRKKTRIQAARLLLNCV